jgi:hypothetical protein
MVAQIISNTPVWVWALFLALIWLGSKQLMFRVTGFGRVVRMALLMTAFSLYGTVSAFGASPEALACWLGAALAACLFVLRLPLAEGTRYMPEKRAFELPGSAVPLGLMLGIFSVKYVAGVMIAMHAPLVQTALFAPVLGLMYGAFSGIFLGRAGRLVRLTSGTFRTI